MRLTRTGAIRGVLVAVDSFAGLSACGGGITPAVGVETFPPEWLNGTPFKSYLVPALILAVVVGGGAVAAALTLLFNLRVGVMASLLAGATMVGWISGEVLILNQPSAPTGVECLYFGIGLAMAGLGVVLRKATAQPMRSR